MLQYLRWLWKEAPRALRMEFLITLLAVIALAAATVVLLRDAPVSRSWEGAGISSSSVP